MSIKLWAAGTAALLIAVTGCSKDDGKEDAAPVTADGPTWTASEVADATGNHGIKPVFDVPKELPDDLVLAYINPSLAFPFFKTMSEGQHAAAEFYGVDFYEADLGNFNFADVVNKYNALTVHDPTVVGTLTPAGEGLLAATDADGVLLLPSGIPIPGAEYFVGTPERETGLLAGTTLADAVQERLDSDWSGRDVVFAGLAQTATSTTVERVEGGLEGFKESIDPADDQILDLGKSATAVDGTRVMADFLTAHPDEAIAVVAMNDEAGVGALQAVQRAGREDDVLIVTIGGDEFGRDALANDDDVIVGEVDLNPYAAGWRWVEAAIAISMGEDFVVPPPDRVVTDENVDELYPEN